MIRVRVIFKGRVQGVYFRAHTKDKADELGIRGWVMNLANGDVEAVFEGDEDKIEELVEYCKSGQPHAKVEEATMTLEDFKSEFADFEIRRRIL
jgi:acylphosphatase